MRKILNVIMILLIAVSFSNAVAIDDNFDIEEVAGLTEYEINMGLKNFVADAYAGVISSCLSLPVMEKFKLGIYFSIEDAMDNTYTKTKTTAGIRETQNWTAIDNYLAVFLGIPISNVFELSVMIGGGTDFDQYKLETDTDPAKTLGYAKKEIIDGEGLIDVGLGILLKSDLFNKVINDMYIRQFFGFKVGGNGPASADFAAAIPAMGPSVFTDTFDNLAANDYQKYEYFGFSYEGVVGTSIPFEVGLPLFELGFELGYDIGLVTYTKVITKTLGVENTPYEDNGRPFGFTGGFDFEINLALNPTDCQENNFWIIPGYHYSSLASTATGAKKIDVGTHKFTLEVGADWKATFAKIVFIKLDAFWTFTREVAFQNNLNTETEGEMANAGAGVVRIENAVDPGITVGFNFDCWTAEFEWNPNVIINMANTANTNVWNLANWNISVSCKFAPPSK